MSHTAPTSAPRTGPLALDVAKWLRDWRDRPPEQWLATPNRYLPPLAAGLLVIAIAHQLATLTWALVPGSMSFTLPAPRVVDGRTAPTADYAALLSSHLFGEPAEQPQVAPVPVADAPDTTLSLTLTGILSREGDTNGSAGIKSAGNDERAYYVGQSIEGADGATLHSVYADRVLLNRGGRLETLRLPTELAASAPPARMTAPLPPTASSTVPLRDVLSQNAARLGEIIRPAPHVQEGQVIGIRVTPGRDRTTFEALGFRSGDVVTDINGTVLDDISQALQLFEALGESIQANVTVLRDGVPQVLVIDTTELQGSQANRE